jgi:hypothetical protein
MAHRGRVKTRIDAAEEDLQVASDHVANRLFSCGEELFFGWLPGFRQLGSVNFEVCFS